MANHPQLSIADFSPFFEAVSTRKPFRWQVRLAERAVAGDWPEFIKLPTSSGKTSCLEIAVFALAVQACRQQATGQPIDAPRRIFFVVDRRIIVNEAYERALQLKRRLHEALATPSGPVHSVAWWLRQLAGHVEAPPLDCFELRGGIYRDDAWVRSLLQPTIVTSTVDQVGSRLLFRGYGVSDRNLPIHAALTANDALIILDEAHCSNPFSQTLSSIARYRDAESDPTAAPRWAEQPLRTPFRFVQMTATPRSDLAEAAVFRLDATDYAADPPLEQRHGCAKPIRLEASKAKGRKQSEQLAADMFKHAESLAAGTDGQPACVRVAVIVNRVDCARQVFRKLRDQFGDTVELMIGRMRPIDRDRLTEKLQQRFRSGSEHPLDRPHFVVATQCLEVGADFDFDGLVSQCASLDALRQRFGRLNRLGQSSHARGIIVMAEGDRAPATPDPIYGEALPETWTWLQTHAQGGVIDFGVRALAQALKPDQHASPEVLDQLNGPMVHAPVLMPAHLDLLCQTGPRPALEPEIAPFLHGPNRGIAEVRVCWRADLPPRPPKSLAKHLPIWLNDCRKTLAVCPPSSAECLSVPLSQFKAWLRGDEDRLDDGGDLLGEEPSPDDEPTSRRRADVDHRYGVVWSGSGCRATSGQANEITNIAPNSLVVLPVTAGGWSVLGHVPDAPPEPRNNDKHQGGDRTDSELYRLALIDEGTAALEQSRNRPLLRVHRGILTSKADEAALAGLWEQINPDADWKHALLEPPFPPTDEASKFYESETTPGTELLPKDAATDGDSIPVRRAQRLIDLRVRLFGEQPQKVTCVRYPEGLAIIGPRQGTREALPRSSFDDEQDEQNLEADSRLPLFAHLRDVAGETARLVAAVGLPPTLAASLIAAAERHDLGKADLRFQARLLGSSLDVAAMQPKLWAKSAAGVVSDSDSTADNALPTRDRLPVGFRHEMLSLQLAQKLADALEPEARELMQHVIAAHHGHARPFAPVVLDDEPLDVELWLEPPDMNQSAPITLSADERLRFPAHALDSGISERFWKLNRRFGWWGLARLESVLRLADWVASAVPFPSKHPLQLVPLTAPIPATNSRDHRLECIGLNGTNPLGFLAALGLFRHVAIHLQAEVRLQWQITSGTWSPVLIGHQPVLADRDQFLDWLSESLKLDPRQHWLKQLNELPDDQLELMRPSAYSMAAREASLADRTAADWLSCNGSDLCPPSSNNQLQTARRDYFPKNVAAIIEVVNRHHLTRSIFQHWDYADPIDAVSLHLEPREDRRHAYQWHKPVGDPTRALRGGMIGANRLAMEAWPLFQSISVRGDLQTIGFRGTRPTKGITWTWPLWNVPLTLCEVTPVLNLAELQARDSDHGSAASDELSALTARGIAAVFRLRRILVEKTPNFTSPVAVLSSSRPQ